MKVKTGMSEGGELSRSIERVVKISSNKGQSTSSSSVREKKLNIETFDRDDVTCSSLKSTTLSKFSNSLLLPA